MLLVAMHLLLVGVFVYLLAVLSLELRGRLLQFR